MHSDQLKSDSQIYRNASSVYINYDKFETSDGQSINFLASNSTYSTYTQYAIFIRYD